MRKYQLVSSTEIDVIYSQILSLYYNLHKLKDNVSYANILAIKKEISDKGKVIFIGDLYSSIHSLLNIIKFYRIKIF